MVIKNKTIYIKELKKYTISELKGLFDCEYEYLKSLLKKLKEYGILKTIKKSEEDIDDLQYEDEIISEIDESDDDINYVFNYVGVVIVGGVLLKCYPKYIESDENLLVKLKKVLKVIEKYNSKEQVIKMYNQSILGGSFNLLAISLFLLNDYFEKGIYKNDEDIIETNGMGDINWDRTINETFTLISNNKPYYIDLQTKKRRYDERDFFTRLHQIILTKISKELEKMEIFELFDIIGVDLSDEDISDIGDKEYISYMIEKELNVEFNTRKQNLLKLFYTYVNKNASIDDIDCLSMYGTQSFNLVWEEVCANIFDNKLNTKIKDLGISITKDYGTKTLIELIEKPLWTYANELAKDTFIPDIISLINKNDKITFLILDAKYYYPIIEKEKMPRGQPGIESVAKQYLYQLAYKDFIKDNNINYIKNYFLFPTESNEIIDKGEVKLDMLHNLELENIGIKFIPVKTAYDCYLNNKKIDINFS